LTQPLVIACGALTREIRAVLGQRGLTQSVEVLYLPANLHNRPDQIVPKIEPLLAEAVEQRRDVFIGYADCGTGGHLDALLDAYPGVERLLGAHCYEVIAGPEEFARMSDEALGTFYLTDFLARSFEVLIWQGLGMDRHPELKDMYFGNYEKLVLLSQSANQEVLDAAKAAAERLGLELVIKEVGHVNMERAVPVEFGRPKHREVSV